MQSKLTILTKVRWFVTILGYFGLIVAIGCSACTHNEKVETMSDPSRSPCPTSIPSIHSDYRLAEFSALTEMKFPSDTEVLTYHSEGLDRFLKISLPRSELGELLNNSPFRNERLQGKFHRLGNEELISGWQPERSYDFLAGGVELKSLRALTIEIDFDDSGTVIIYLLHFVV